MIKLIATDLDGTLFYPKYKYIGIPMKNRIFLRDFLEKGGKVVLISGRNALVVPKIEKQLKHKVSIICCNGSYIREDGKLFDSHPLNKDKLVDLYASLTHNYGILFWLLFNQYEYINYQWQKPVSTIYDIVMNIGNDVNGFHKEILINDTEQFMKKLASGDVHKAMLVTGIDKMAPQRASETAVALRRRYGDAFSIAASRNSIEITALGIDKGTTLMKYCKERGISPDEVMCCGDSGNDLTMFKYFPHSFAMSHASDTFKSCANHVIDRIHDLKEYIDHPELMEKDEVIDFDIEKVLETN